jgi:hypothetical protein
MKRESMTGVDALINCRKDEDTAQRRAVDADTHPAAKMMFFKLFDAERPITQ